MRVASLAASSAKCMFSVRNFGSVSLVLRQASDFR